MERGRYAGSTLLVLATAIGLLLALAGAASGHETGAVGDDALMVGVGQEPPSALSFAARSVLYAGLALVVGAAATALVAFRSVTSISVPVVIAPWLLAVLGFGILVWSEASSDGTSAGTLVGSRPGERLIGLGVAITALTLAGAAVLVRPDRGTVAGAGIAAAVAMFAYVLTGHASAPSRFRAANLTIAWVHLVAVGAWIGGLVWLVAWTWRRRTPASAEAVARFSRMAGYAVVLVVVTGLMRALDSVRSIRSLFETGYGRALVGKLLLFGAVLALGAVNRYRIVPRLHRFPADLRRLHRSVGGEIGLAIGVLGATGLMAGLIPPSQQAAHEAGAPGAGVVVVGSDVATSIRARLTVAPTPGGTSELEVRITDVGTEQPVEADRVALRASRPGVGPSLVELAETGRGVWTAEDAVLSVEGEWDVTVIVEAAPLGWEIPLEVTIGERGGAGGRARPTRERLGGVGAG